MSAPKKPAKPTAPAKPSIKSASGEDGGPIISSSGGSKKSSRGEQNKCKMTPTQIAQLSATCFFVISSGICLFFALDFRKIRDITQKIMSTKATNTVTYAYF